MSSHGEISASGRSNWNARSDWVVSAELTHPALVSDDDFLAVQEVTALAVPQNGQARRYAFTGLLVCQLCGRRLEGHWVNRQPAYRCRHARTSARPAHDGDPRWVYWSQRRIVREVTTTLGDAMSVEDLAGWLRAREAVIICGTSALQVQEPATNETDLVPTVQEPVIGQLELQIPPLPQRAERAQRRRKPRPEIPKRTRRAKPPAEALTT
jgi:site-specific DNA recombinase